MHMKNESLARLHDWDEFKERKKKANTIEFIVSECGCGSIMLFCIMYIICVVVLFVVAVIFVSCVGTNYNRNAYTAIHTMNERVTPSVAQCQKNGKP